LLSSLFGDDNKILRPKSLTKFSQLDIATGHKPYSGTGRFRPVSKVTWYRYFDNYPFSYEEFVSDEVEYILVNMVMKSQIGENNDLESTQK
jgi:hypothetical protein